MIRDSGADAKAVHSSCLLQKQHGILTYARKAYGGNTDYANINWNQALSSGWCKLTKAGNAVTAFRSHDGMNWEQMDTLQINYNSSNVEVGVAVSGDWNKYGTVAIENFRVVSS